MPLSDWPCGDTLPRGPKEGAGPARVLVFDTETTGLPRHGRVFLPGSRGWPRLVQAAWVLYEGSGRECGRRSMLVQPSGFTIPKSATAIHGITTERACRDGVPLRAVLHAFAQDMAQAHVVVAHNMIFDQGVIAAECWREGFPDPISGKGIVCTMLASARLAGRSGRVLSLDELYQTLFSCGREGAHDAERDAEACARCFFELVRRGDIRV